MRFSNILPAAAGLAGVASATLGKLPILSDLVKDTEKIVKPVFDLAHHWEDDILFKGEISASTETSAAVDLNLHLIQAAVAGEVSLDVSAKFLERPALRLSLAGVKAFVQLDLSASASLYESVELFITPELSVDLLEILDIDIKALIALDLVVGASAAIDVSAGVYVSFEEDAFIDIDLIKRDVLDINLANPIVEALPIAIGADVDLSVAVDLHLGLRLRTYIAVEADIEIIGIDILEAGAEVAIFVNLFDYTTTLIDGTGDCVVSVSKDIALTLGLAVRLNVSILELIDVSLTPNVFLTLATVAELDICLPDRGTFPDGSELIEGDDSEDSDSGNGEAEEGDSEIPEGSEEVDDSEGSDGSEGSEGSDDSEDGSEDGAAVVTPAPAVETPAPGSNSTISTSTEKITTTYTITKCEIDVVNCPASKKTIVVHSTVYDCPATKTKVPQVPEITKTHTMTPCPTPTTVTVTDTPTKPTGTPDKPEGDKPEGETPEEETPEEPEHDVPEKPEGDKPEGETPEETPEQPEHEVPEKPEDDKPEHEAPEEPEHDVPEMPEGDKPEHEAPEEEPEHVCPGSPDCPEETFVEAPPAPTGDISPPVSTPTPTEPATAGAGSIKVGMASVCLGAVFALML